MKKVVAILTGVLLSTSQAQALNLSLPDLGDYSSSAVSIPAENKIGDYVLRNLQGVGKDLDDPVLRDYISDLLYNLAPYAHLPNTDLHPVVINSEELNAFAVPGGIIGVNAGLIEYTDNQDQLASVFAHELTHLSQRHYAQQVTQDQKERPLWIATTIAGVIAGLAAGSADVGAAALTSSMAARQGRVLSYSRLHEAEADRIGIQVLAAAGYDPYAMPAMLEKLQRDFSNNTKVPELLLSHPLTRNRIADAEARAASYPRVEHPVDPRFLMMQARARVLLNKADQKTLSYYQARVHELPDNAGAHYGLVLTEVERKEANNAKASMDWLHSRFKNDLAVETLRARFLDQTGDAKGGIDLLKDYWTIFPGNLIVGTELAKLQESHNDLEGARRTWATLAREHPEIANVWYNLAEVEGRLQHIFPVHEARIEYFMHTTAWELAKRQIRYARATRGITKEDNDILDSLDAELKDWEDWVKSMR